MDTRPWQRHYDFDVPTTIRYPQVPAHHFLHIPATGFPNKPATNFYGTELTYWELRAQALAMANALGDLGIRKGDRIGLHLPNCPQYVIAYFAVLSLGAIVVNLNPMYTAEELNRCIQDTSIGTLFTFDMVLDNIRAVYHRGRALCAIVTRVTDYIDGFPKSTAAEMALEEGWRHFSDLLANATSRKIPQVTIHPHDPALIQFTGGTTGIPKGAVLTHHNIVAATLQCSLWGSVFTKLTPTVQKNVMAVLPFFHIYGTIVVLNWAVFNCATTILVPRFEIDEFMGILANFQQITFFPAVPTMINAVINHPKAAGLDLGKKLGLFNSGGGPMPVELIQQTRDMGINYGEGWGMSETTSLGMGNPVLGLKKAGSIGIPFPDMDVRIVDIASGQEDVPQGEPGELIVRSPLVMKGYWENPEETAGQLKGGWLHTGDIAVQDEDDYFAIVDRKKDMIIAGGYNIYPREIDEVLYQHPDIVDACSIGVPDAYRGETVKAFVVPRAGAALTAENVIDFCRQKLAAYKTPKIVEFRKELPKSAVGKILRRALREEDQTPAK
jgi:long-chain acyl-CoA synthetase